ncbi:hypothetical protein J2X65_000471 [Ancylobacter sp. 3268]|uniref:hypothetical protein n=1 Tax=Ancylobacter sp. 3268 TaxID=2817752 RepID=UPI00285E5D87|nr:hypothetical protein [Ancylobacter sp. 3268]MDR6951123.1 hypothetical protein [Ancylobacter sp. 3268]
MEIRQGIDSLRIDNCTIISSKPISFYGRHQSNIEITNCFLSGRDWTGEPPESLEPVIAFWINGTTTGSVDQAPYAQNIDSRNITIRNNHIKNGTYAVHHSGVKISECRDINIDGNIFENITSGYFRLYSNNGTQWASDGSLGLRNNEARGLKPPIDDPIDIGAQTVLVMGGNNFANRPVGITLSGTTLTVPSSAVPTLYVRLTDVALNVERVVGLNEGQILIVSKTPGPNTITFVNGAGGNGSMALGGPRELKISTDRIILVGTLSGATQGAALISFADNS